MRLLVAAAVLVVVVGRRKEEEVCARKAEVAPLLLAAERETVAMHVREYNMNVDMAMDNQVTADAAPTLMLYARLPLVV